MNNLKSLAIAAALVATAVAPAAATIRCHGHSSPDGWVLNVPSWTDAEIKEAESLTVQLKKINPDSTETVADTAAILDQFACQGIDGTEALIGVANLRARMK